MITERVRRMVFERDSYRCQVQGHRCTGVGEEISHVLFHDRKGRRDSLAVRNWVDERWNLEASCHNCNAVMGEADNRPQKEKFILRMMRLDEIGLLEWYRRKPAKLQDKEIQLIIARQVTQNYTQKGEQQ